MARNITEIYELDRAIKALGYKIKKDGTPRARLERISGFKFKEE